MAIERSEKSHKGCTFIPAGDKPQSEERKRRRARRKIKGKGKEAWKDRMKENILTRGRKRETKIDKRNYVSTAGNEKKKLAIKVRSVCEERQKVFT